MQACVCLVPTIELLSLLQSSVPECPLPVPPPLPTQYSLDVPSERVPSLTQPITPPPDSPSPVEPEGGPSNSHHSNSSSSEEPAQAQADSL